MIIPIIIIHVYLLSGLTAHCQCGALHLKYHLHEHLATCQLKYHLHEHLATCQLKTVTVRDVAIHLLHEKERWLVGGT